MFVHVNTRGIHLSSIAIARSFDRFERDLGSISEALAIFIKKKKTYLVT
jgi:hypothetical protein